MKRKIIDWLLAQLEAEQEQGTEPTKRRKPKNSVPVYVMGNLVGYAPLPR